MLLDAVPAVRLAKEWAQQAPRYAGEFSFGPSSGETVVFGVFGDSVGCGLGVTQVERTFAGTVARRLAERRRIVCRIKAFSGARGRDLLAQGAGGDERFVAVSIGTNDILSAESPSRLESDLCRFLESLRHVERTVIAGPGDLASALIVPQWLRPLLKRRVAACEAALRRAVRRFPNARHFGPTDLALTLSADDFAVDGFHPSERAHALIADAVFSRLVG